MVILMMLVKMVKMVTRFKAFDSPALHMSFSGAGLGSAVRCCHIEFGFHLMLQKKTKKTHFLETQQKTNRLFVQALSGMASKVPFTEDRVALAGDGGDDLGGGDDDVVSDESCDL